MGIRIRAASDPLPSVVSRTRTAYGTPRTAVHRPSRGPSAPRNDQRPLRCDGRIALRIPGVTPTSGRTAEGGRPGYHSHRCGHPRAEPPQCVRRIGVLVFAQAARTQARPTCVAERAVSGLVPDDSYRAGRSNVIRNRASVSQRRNSGSSLKCRNSSVSSFITSTIARPSALSCSTRAFCSSEFRRAFA